VAEALADTVSTTVIGDICFGNIYACSCWYDSISVCNVVSFERMRRTQENAA